MSHRRIGESKKDYDIRMEKEEVEAATHIKQRIFERDENYIERAQKEDVIKRAGSPFCWFGTGEKNISRAKNKVIKDETGVNRRRRESELEYVERAQNTALDEYVHPNRVFPISDKKCKRNKDKNTFIAREMVAGTKQKIFESDRAYKKRVDRKALENIAENSGIGFMEFRGDHDRKVKLDALNKNPSLVKLLGLDK